MDAAEIVRESRQWAGLSQRELGERAGTSGSAISFYESGERLPRVDTLHRIVAATGGRLTVAVELDRGTSPVDVERNGEALEQLLGLADALPRQRSRTLEAPILGLRNR